ncbi:BglG family transcription antiterminator [Alkalihalobacillus oceani]|uniref:BglG family transcription antiterminator n=1 Tax=Halalkalibacter oceani TaxID=1653776 RepID=A0A9X2DUN0_9BACI|nr:BglG family transcription antiterminator [Halalkalibacter oceani]MCM3715720.1 BglG family transcription antiterminator [Halalkalibacter oceani]
MFITSREKSIIDLIVKTSGKHTVHSLSTFLNVSVRTIQRDLKSIEKMLRQFELGLDRTGNEGLFIKGKNEQIYRLIQHLANVDPTDETPEERKLRLLVTLLHEGPSFKKQVLAQQLGVSGATLTSYLDDIADWLSKFSITVTRKRGVGIELVAHEENKRHALASYVLIYFYEDLLESLYLLQQGKTKTDHILGYFVPEYFGAIDELLQQEIKKAQISLADSDYIGLIVHICLTMQRTEQRFLLELDYPAESEKTAEFQWVAKICRELKERLSIPITQSDIHFLTVILRGSKVQTDESVYYDSIVLGKLIKAVINEVSAKLHVNLSDDFSLYRGLLAHMAPAIYRLKQQLESFNPLTEDIKRKYPVLFMVVKQSLETHFKDIPFPEDEVAFIVLHFGSALLMREEKVSIKAVVVCPTGIGTSKMLASRIKNEVAEIKTVDILSIKDFQTEDLEEYDLVISTVRLPFTNIDYILVSPLLDDHDIEIIQQHLQRNVERVTRNKQYLAPVNQPVAAHQATRLPAIRILLQEIKDVYSSMDSILDHFNVFHHAGNDYWSVLTEMVERAEQDGLLTNPADVIERLKEREHTGGLGIPQTTMALYHCRADGVRELIFQVAHFGQPCRMKGMDGEEMPVKNLLLMLAPENMNKREQEILSMISTSLIESDRAMMIFSSANETMIRQKLEDLFLDYLQNQLIKD